MDPTELERSRRFVDPAAASKLLRHLTCSICCDVFEDPMRAPCGHSFCRQCIMPWLKRSKTCPEDRKKLRENQLHEDFILSSIIGDQMVACPFRLSHGCPHVCELQHLKAHQASCCFNPSNVPYWAADRPQSCRASVPAAPSSDGPATSRKENVSPDESEALPSPTVPTLRMRLFNGGSAKKRLLHALFAESTDAAAHEGEAGEHSGAPARQKDPPRKRHRRAATAASGANAVNGAAEAAQDAPAEGGGGRTRGRRRGRGSSSLSQWQCFVCTLLNERTARSCDACGASRLDRTVSEAGVV